MYNIFLTSVNYAGKVLIKQANVDSLQPESDPY